MPLSYSEFCRALDKGNWISLAGAVPADLDTPVSAFLKMKEADSAFLLESTEGVERWGRYSFLGVSPCRTIQAFGSDWTVETRGLKKIESGKGDPLEVLRRELNRFKHVPAVECPVLCGGAIGYLGYDQVRFIEKLPVIHPVQKSFPDFWFGIYDQLVVFDNYRQEAFALVHVFADGKTSSKTLYEKGIAQLQSLQKRLQKPVSAKKQARILSQIGPWTDHLPLKSYSEATKRAQAYIQAGDIFQVVLSAPWTAKGKIDGFSLYRSLRSLNPSPYLFYLKMGAYTLTGSSPEMLVKLEKGHATLRPIAGTLPRGKNFEEDLELERELLEDPKERAEHIMLVDLGRNDLGRVCRPGSVKVSEFMTVERYSHVMHLVSNVEGSLQKNKDAFDLLRATFPAGTLSGAPKIRAMEIIEELEPMRRGFYGGAVGYIDFSGNMDFAITIRSVALTQDQATIHAGGGIVQDSIPEKEYAERCNKAEVLKEAMRRTCV